MASFNDIATSLRVTTQLPLDNKMFSNSQATLANLGDSNNLAFTYYDNLKVFCWNEKTEFVWREVQDGEENTGLVPSDFVYPNGVVYPNPGYEGKSYNFFKVDPGTSTKLLAGNNIFITGDGSSITPYIISSNYVYTPLPSEIPPFIKETEGSGYGIYLRARSSANYGPIGLSAFDVSISSETSSIMGATGENSVAFGENTVAGGIRSVSYGIEVENYGDNSFAHGTNLSLNGPNSFIAGVKNVVLGKTNTVFGIGNVITGSCITALGQASTIQNYTQIDYNIDPTKPVLVVGNGTIDNNNDNVLTRSDALIVRHNGNVEAPSSSIAGITAASTKTLTTKEYVLNVSGKNYKEYVVKLSQTSTNNPTIVGGSPLQNDFISSIVWTRSLAGQYIGTLIAAFTANKTVVTCENITSGTSFDVRVGPNDANTVLVRTFNAASLADNILNNTAILIRVYN